MTTSSSMWRAPRPPPWRGRGAPCGPARCLSVAAYHLPGDIVAVPEQLQAILQGDDRWRFAFSHFSQSFEDSVVYAYRPAED